MLKQWTRFFMTNNEKKKRNSREGVASYLKKKTSQTLRKEVSEGVTYDSSAGLNLDPTYHQTVSQNVFEMPAEISRTELKGYEEITPPYTIRPKIVHLQYDSKQKYKFIIFDTETTCTGKLAEMCQLSAVSENGKHEFSTYILPKSNTS